MHVWMSCDCHVIGLDFKLTPAVVELPAAVETTENQNSCSC